MKIKINGDFFGDSDLESKFTDGTVKIFNETNSHIYQISPHEITLRES